MAEQNHTVDSRRFTRFLIFLGITLFFSLLAGTAYSANLTLAWDANSEPDLIGYRVYCGESSGNYTVNHDITSSDPNDPPPTTYEFTGLEEGKTYYLAAKAISQTGESAYSQEISYTVPAAPVDPDGDNDGFTVAQGDCNDEDSSINPGSTDVCGDGIDQDCSGADVVCPDDNSLVREAQVGELIGDFEIISDPMASSGTYVYVPNGVGTRMDGPDETHKIIYSFNLLKAGTYRIKGAVYAANGSDDSFWVKVNGSPVGGYLWDVLQNTSYQQDYVNDRNGADPVEVSLQSGLNTVTVYLREDGTRLGRIELELMAATAPASDLDGDGITVADGDCNDNSAAVYPGATEICGDDIDQDCDGNDLFCSEDIDDDGDLYTENQGDCNDNNPSINPDAVEICGDGIDQDCSGADVACPNDDSLVKEAQTGELTGDFETSSDPAASSGTYVYVPNGFGNRMDGPDETQKIIFAFNLPEGEAGIYRIKGTVYAANGSDDSFWVKVNDSPAGGYLWDVLQNTSYQQDYVNDRNGADPVEVSLKSGPNTVTVYLREDGTRLDKIELELVATAGPVNDKDGDGYTENQGDCNDNSATVYLGATEICGDGIDQDCSGADLTCSEDEGMAKEAEDGNLIGAFEIGSDPAASGGRYVYVPGWTSSWTPNEAKKVEYTFNVSSPGNYRIRAWVYAPDTARDSFFVKVNGSPSDGYEWHVLRNTVYSQDYVRDGVGTDPVEIWLAVGSTTITVYQREAGTRLDRIELEPVTASLPIGDNDGDGYTEAQGDCNDNSAGVYPDAEEICGDGIDQDCSGGDLPCLEDIDEKVISEIRVAASSDDAEENASGRVGTTSSDLEVTYDRSFQTVGMRFSGTAIPAGANIVNAYIQFQTDETQSVATSLTIQGEDTDNAGSFLKETRNISSRPRTAAAVSWFPPAWTTVGEAGPNQRTPDITSVIQEIVNRPGWSSDNAMVLIITGTGERVAESYDGNSAGAPLLHVEFTPGN